MVTPNITDEYADERCAECGERLGGEPIAEVVFASDVASPGDPFSEPDSRLIHQSCFSSERHLIA